MLRTVAAEELDQLEAHDPRALASRRDLRRVHRAMGTRGLLLRGWARTGATRSAAPRILELGAGDGTLMLGVAKRLARDGQRGQITLLDREPCVDAATIEDYARLGWTADVAQVDVQRWASTPPTSAYDVIVATLFLHHFSAETLTQLLAAAAVRCRMFIACEPQRDMFSLAFSHLVGLLGANSVTRTDAVLSVRAGFRDDELSQLWPQDGPWRLHETRAGLFSHCLSASRDA